MKQGLRIFIDADACPVKNETYKVAERYEVPVIVVANSYMRIPRESWITQIVVNDGFDAADDYIADECNALSIIITADILLAERCLKKCALVIGPNGKPFTENSIGQAVASRALMNDLRAMGEISGGPAPFSKEDRSRFLSALDLMVNRQKRAQNL